MELYSIEMRNYTSPKRYIKYCDDCWYETDESSTPRFTLKETERIAEQMKKHFTPSHKLCIRNTEGEECFIKQEEVETSVSWGNLTGNYVKQALGLTMKL